MKRGKLLGVVFVIVMLIVLLAVGCVEPTPTTPTPTPTPGPTPSPVPTPGPTPTPVPTEVIELTHATFHPAEDPINSVINAAWWNWLENKSGGRLTFTLFPGGTAAPAEGLYDAARTHIVDMADPPAPNQYPDRFPVMEVGILPFIVNFPGSRTTGMMMSALYDKYPELQAEHPEVHVICFHTSGPNQPSTTKKPIRTLEDWEGLMMIDLGLWGAKATQAFGATPVTMSPAEYPDAMKKGVVDGIISNFFATNLFGHIEVVNYITQANMYMDPFVTVMNLDTWNSLPADIQQLFIDSYWVMPELYGYDFDQADQFMRGEIEKILEARGMPGIYILPEAEKARWIEAATPVYDEWVEKVTPIIGEATARAMLADARKFAEQYRYETTPVEETKRILHEWGAPGY